MKTARDGINWAEALSLLALVVAVGYLWDSRWVYPLKVLVVFFHELSHAVVALLTGGSIIEIAVVADEGGMCVTSGGNRFLTLSAGYLGSLLWGGLLLVLASRTPWHRSISIITGLVLIGASLRWIEFGSFGFFFGIGMGLGLVLAGRFLRHSINETLQKVIGLTSCLYAVLDIKSDILDRPHLQSDARMLAEEFGLPALFWGCLWGVLAVAGGVGFLMISCRKKRPGGSSP